MTFVSPGVVGITGLNDGIQKCDSVPAGSSSVTKIWPVHGAEVPNSQQMIMKSYESMNVMV